MSLSDGDLEATAAMLDEAALSARPVSPLSDRIRFDLVDAYSVQARLVARRLARGEHLIGLKMGFTSEAMRRQMAVEAPNCGWLTDRMLLADGEALAINRFIHPRIEPEIAVRLIADLDGEPDDATVAASVGACAAAIEVVDSRYHDYRFSLADNTADNSSAAGLALGPWCAPTDLRDLNAELFIDGECAARGSSNAVMGSPLHALKEAARLAMMCGRPLRRGMIVITGGITAAPFVQGGQSVRAVVHGLGQVRFDVGSLSL